MTYEDLLINGLERLANAHNEAFIKYCSDDVKALVREHNCVQNMYIALRNHVPQSEDGMTMEHYNFDAPMVPVCLRLDIINFIYELKCTREPEFYNSVVGDPSAPAGFFLKITEEWSIKYKRHPLDQKVQQFLDVICDDERLKERYTWFNEFISLFGVQ